MATKQTTHAQTSVPTSLNIASGVFASIVAVTVALLGLSIVLYGSQSSFVIGPWLLGTMVTISAPSVANYAVDDLFGQDGISP